MSTPSLPIDLAGVIAFVRVAEAGSFAEAARRAGTTTSAMSKAILRFERARGLRLFHRTTHSIALTEEGDRLLESGRELMAGLDRFGDALGSVAAGRGLGRVRITAPASFARACILPALPGFLAANPGLEIEVRFRNELLDLAAEGVDIALRTGAVSGLPGHRVQKLFAFPWIACAAPAYLAGRVPKTPADLAAHDHVGFRNPATGQVLTWRFADPRSRATLRFTPKPRHVFDDAHAAMGLMREGFGIGWGPAWLIGDDVREGRVVEVLRDWRVPEEPLWLLRSSHRQTPERTRRAIAFLASLPQNWRVGSPAACLELCRRSEG